MNTKTFHRWAAPMLALGLIPATAIADEAMDQCKAECSVDCAQACESGVYQKTGQLHSKKAGKLTKRTTASSPKFDVDVDVTVKEKGAGEMAGMPPYQPISQADRDQIRAEERARAAEQFNAQEERLKDQHQAEVDRVRADERARAENQIAAVKAADKARLDKAMMESKEDKELIKDALVTPVGLYALLSGGATNFTQPRAFDSTSTGGFWDVRAGIGSRSVIGAEVAYHGTARDIDVLGLNNGAYLTGNGLEGVARLNVPITMERAIVEPYTFGGIGWQHYALANVSTNSSSVDDTDDIATFPLGVGLNVGFSGLTLDGRFTYRHALGSDLFGSPTSSFDRTSLNSWGLGGGIGFEF